MATNRTVFARQPARILMIDLGDSFDATTCHNICSTLEELFSLVCSLGGPCRVPFFGLFALGNYPDALFPLQHVRGNYGRIQSALEELKTYQREARLSSRPQQANTDGRITQGLHEATATFRRQAQSLLQTAGYWAQLEICILTCENINTVSRQAEKATRDITMDSLKKVQVLSVSNPEKLLVPDVDMTISQSSSRSGSSSSQSDLTGLVDFVSIENDCLSMQNFFRGWLHDIGTDREHLHLTWPESDGLPLVLKCDIHERLLSPALLPFHSYFSLNSEAQASKSLPTSNTKGGVSVPIHSLKVLHRIPVDAVCESVLYGMPLMIRATTCWKIDWDELDVNHKHFQALCHTLNKSNEALLTALLPQKSDTKSSFQYKPKPPTPHGHFLLLPSQSEVLLLKPIAVNELLLPCPFTTIEEVDEESERIVTQALDQVPTKSSYNPLRVHSDLHGSLICQLTKNLPGQTKKRNYSKLSTGRGRGKPSMESGEVWGITSAPPKSTQPPPPIYSGALDDAFPTEL